MNCCLPRDILLEVLPFFDYLNKNYCNGENYYFNETNCRINITEETYILNINYNDDYLLDEIFAKLLLDFKHFTDNNRSIDIKCYSNDYKKIELIISYKKQDTVHKLKKSVFAKKIVLNMYYELEIIGDELKLNTISIHNAHYPMILKKVNNKLYILETNFYGTISNMQIELVDNYDLPEYSAYVVPVSNEELTFKITTDLQKYLFNDLVLLVVQYFNHTNC